MSERTLALFANADHPAFAGHFPGKPIVPGVVLLDWTIAAIEAAEKCKILPGKLSVAKFLGPVSPATYLLLHYRMSATAKIDFRIEHDTRVIASGTLQAQESSQ